MTDCRLPGCTRDRDNGRFCSTRCEVKYDHLKADARDRRRSERRKA